MVNKSYQSYRSSTNYLLAAVLATGFFFLGRVSVKFFPGKATPSKETEKKLPDLELPEVELYLESTPDNSTSEVNSSDTSEVNTLSKTNTAMLKALNANVSGIWEEGKLTGLRIVGELQNIGQETVSDATSVVRFYRHTDEDTSEVKSPQLLATKIGQWNQGYRFLPLKPGEISLYDILIPNPPESETITVELKAAANSSTSEVKSPDTSEVFLGGGQILKITQKSFEQASLPRGDEEQAYFKFSATLVNTSNQEIINPTIYVWVKDDQGKVIASAYKTYQSDLLTANQELETNLILLPFSPGSGQSFSYDVQTYGEKME